MELTNEIIMAYVDGMLDPKEHDSISTKIKNNEDALKKVEEYKRSKQLLSNEFSYLRNEKPPQFLINTVKKNIKKKSNVIELFSMRQIQSMAASLAVGLFVGIFIMKFSGTSGDKLLFDTAPNQATSTSLNNGNNNIDNQTVSHVGFVIELHKALKESPNAKKYTVTIDDVNYSLVVATTFTDINGQFCKILNSNIKDLHYISSCIRKDGKWEIKLIN